MTVDEIMAKVHLGMDRRQVEATLGEPTDVSIIPRRWRHPAIYKYGDIELHFGKGFEGKLWLIYSEDNEGNPTTHAKL